MILSKMYHDQLTNVTFFLKKTSVKIKGKIMLQFFKTDKANI